MRKIMSLMIAMLFSFGLYAQIDTLIVSVNKTTSIVFPQIIKAVDKGSKDVLAQKVKDVDNVLQVKAAKDNFAETNMTVITANGKLYSFILRYGSEPNRLHLQIDSTSSMFEKIAMQNRSVYGIRNWSYDVGLLLKGLFIDNDILYWQLEFDNFSNITYDIDLLRFYIKDKKQSKRTASQELSLIPLSVFGNANSVRGQSRQTIVVAMPKFTIPDKKKFYITTLEKNGGRILQLRIKNKIITKAQTLAS